MESYLSQPLVLFLSAFITMEHHQLLSISELLLSSLIFIFMALKILKTLSKSNHSSSNNLPPGPSKLPLIGNLHQFIGHQPHHRLRDLANTYGSIMHIQLGEVSRIVISSPEVAREVMKTNDIAFAQRPSLLAVRIVTYNFTDIIFSPYSDYWRHLKRICMVELLGAKRVQTFRSLREEEVMKLVRNIHSLCLSGQSLNLSHMVFSLIYGITAQATFGKKCKNEEEIIRLFKKLSHLAGGFCLADLFPSMKFLPMISGMRYKLSKIQEAADRTLENIVNEHRCRRNKERNEESSKCEEDDLVDVLLRLQERENLEFSFTTDNIKAVILDIFLAGGETSPTTIEWAMSELLKNPTVMEKAQEEVRRVFGEKGNVDEAGLNELNYLKLVIKETLRLHPPTPFRRRECRERCKINGYDIPEKTDIMVNAWTLGRDPNYWNEPEKFYPERFVDSKHDYIGNHMEFIPFGAGKRMCPGIWFGMANVELPLAQLLYHFDWKLPDGLNSEDLDMTEVFGFSVRRKNELHLIAIPHYHQGEI